MVHMYNYWSQGPMPRVLSQPISPSMPSDTALNRVTLCNHEDQWKVDLSDHWKAASCTVPIVTLANN